MVAEVQQQNNEELLAAARQRQRRQGVPLFSVASPRHYLTSIAPAPRRMFAKRDYANSLGTVVGDASKTTTDKLRSKQYRMGMCRRD